jgi:hypothetical protein
MVFSPMFEEPKVRLYSMASWPEKRDLGAKMVWPK